ncbi:MAG: PEP-CTERM sorting domain-containing protein [Verrucomicrobiae bacterium]|nr:PEP-CTERM sorting domain-containing protein [Verrucomicrobiae bacterium]
MKSNIIKLLATLLSAAFLSETVTGAAIQVDYSAAPGQRDIRLITTNAAVADLNTVAIGYFDNVGGFDPAASAASFTTLLAHWQPFDASGSISTIAAEPGRFALSHSEDLPAFSNQPIHLWIFDTTTNTAPAAFANPAVGAADIEAYGLFTAPGWTFPDTSAADPLSRLIEITSDDAGIVALYGGVIGPVDTGSLVLAAPIPEPTSTVLLVLSGLWVLGFRRRSTRVL